MKKVFLLCAVFCVLFSNVVFSKDSANTVTALRCLKLAESSLINGDWSNALKHAELGLSYDDSISDLDYVCAAAKMNQKVPRADVLQIVRKAFSKNNWQGYSKNGARILFADLLSDTGNYHESNLILDDDPFIYSADAEFIRIKNYYRMGTSDSISVARTRMNGARRIYPNDLRFPNIFFLFEILYMRNAERDGFVYSVPEIVQLIANSYIAKLPDYSGTQNEMELLASFFASDSDKIRLVSAINAKDMTIHPLLAIAGLSVGIYDESQALQLFFDSSDNMISLSLLEKLARMITQEEVSDTFVEKLANFNGTIVIDENNDLQNEVLIKYELGRPSFISYDRNNDGKLELSANCDYGAPVSLIYNNGRTQLFYDVYPKVKTVVFSDFNMTFDFLYEDYLFEPFEITKDNVLEAFGLSFYVAQMAASVKEPNPDDLISRSSSIRLPISERDNAWILYTTLNGKLVNAKFYENDYNYGYCSFENGLPFVRYVDYNNDGVFETTETFDADENFADSEEHSVVGKIFNEVAGQDNIYLKKIQIDANSNTIYEYTEEYLPDGGYISNWDDDDNGIVNCQYIRHSKKAGQPLIEETIFYNDNGTQNVSLQAIDGVPVKMNYGNSEVMIYAGNSEGFYWIDSQGTPELEAAVKDKIKNGLIQGSVELYSMEKTRVSVILINKMYFCRIIPDSVE